MNYWDEARNAVEKAKNELNKPKKDINYAEKEGDHPHHTTTIKVDTSLKKDRVTIYSGNQGANARLHVSLKGNVRIITYSLPSLKYLGDMFRKSEDNATYYIICSSAIPDNITKALAISHNNPNVHIKLHPEVHSKVWITENPPHLLITSANFGKSTWHETTVRIPGIVAAGEYVGQVFDPLWNASQDVREIV